MRKSYKAIILIIIILALSLTALTACTQDSQKLTYNNEVEGRYADGMIALEYLNAPKDATQYTNLRRVVKKIFVDSTVKGYHLTGLYLPAGETVTVLLSAETSQMGNKIVINSHLDNEETIKLDSMKVDINSPNGGLLDIFVNSNETNTPSNTSKQTVKNKTFEVTISGCVEMSYYRLGIDSEKFETASEFVILDAFNLRVSMPTKLFEDTNKIYNVMSWWRAAVEICDRVVGSKDSGKTIFVYAVDGESSVDPKNYVVKLNVDEFANILNYDKLCSGSGWTLLQYISNIKVDNLNNLQLFQGKDTYASIIATLSYDVMTIREDIIYDKAWLVNPKKCLEMSVSGKLNEKDKSCAFVANLLHSFGIEKVSELLAKSSELLVEPSPNNWERFVEIGKEILNVDLNYYCSLFGVVEEKPNVDGKYLTYVPVQSEYTFGGVDFGQGGVIVPMGQPKIFDFNNKIVSTKGEWKISAISGSGSWRKADASLLEAEKIVGDIDNVYVYTPSADRLTDKFTVIFTNGEQNATLLGKIVVDITVATYKEYLNVSYREVDKAISGCKTREPNSTKSVNMASIPKSVSNADKTSYSFSVGEGSMKVPKSGKYTLYLQSSGLCKVDFGVPKYMFKMFENSLTVNNYTDELCYEIELEQDKVYNFKIYLLNTTGEGFVNLGIKAVGAEVEDLDKKYLIFSGLSGEDIQHEDTHKIGIKDFDIQQTELVSHNNNKWSVEENPEAKPPNGISKIIDQSNVTFYESKFKRTEFSFVVNFGSAFYVEYINIVVPAEMVGKSCFVEWSGDNKTYSPYKKVVLTRENMMQEMPINCKFARITFQDSVPFTCYFSEFDIGKVLPQAKIVPSTSTNVLYLGEWARTNKYSGINGVITTNKDDNCALTYKFYGTYFAIYATTAKEFGGAKVFVNNSERGAINLNSEGTSCGKRVLEINLEKPNYYTIKIVPNNKEIINVDYFSIMEQEEPTNVKNEFNLWFLLLIPAIAVVGAIAFFIADAVTKRKMNKRNRN